MAPTGLVEVSEIVPETIAPSSGVVICSVGGAEFGLAVAPTVTVLFEIVTLTSVSLLVSSLSKR